MNQLQFPNLYCCIVCTELQSLRILKGKKIPFQQCFFKDTTILHYVILVVFVIIIN